MDAIQLLPRRDSDPLTNIAQVPRLVRLSVNPNA